MAIDKTVTRVVVFDSHGERAPFTMSIIGAESREFATIPGGGNKVYEAFKLEGLEGYQSSPFFVFKVGEEELSPPRYKKTREKTFVESSPLFSEFNAVFEPKRQPMMRAKNGKGKKK